jgi:hypothetical protein
VASQILVSRVTGEVPFEAIHLEGNGVNQALEQDPSPATFRGRAENPR